MFFWDQTLAAEVSLWRPLAAQTMAGGPTRGQPGAKLSIVHGLGFFCDQRFNSRFSLKQNHDYHDNDHENDPFGLLLLAVSGYVFCLRCGAGDSAFRTSSPLRGWTATRSWAWWGRATCPASTGLWETHNLVAARDKRGGEDLRKFWRNGRRLTIPGMGWYLPCQSLVTG